MAGRRESSIVQGEKQFFAGPYYATSRLPAHQRETLERLVFFNDEQWRMRASMLYSIERYGSPRIVEKAQGLGLELEKATGVQTLFVLKSEAQLSGVVVYRREQSVLHVIYVGLDPGDSYQSDGQSYLLVEIFQLMMSIARRVQGVGSIEFNNGRRRLRLSVWKR